MMQKLKLLFLVAAMGDGTFTYILIVARRSFGQVCL